MSDGGLSQRDITSLVRAAAELSNAPIFIRDEAIMSLIEEEDGRHYLNLKYTRSCPRSRIPLTFRKEYTRFE
jgi:replicative DNA helicase